MAAIKFQPFASAVDYSFWHELTQRKLDVWRLSEEPVHVWGTYLTRAAADELPCQLRVAGTSFVAERPSAATIPGVLVNTNTSEAFVALDRKALLDAACARLVADAQSGAAQRDPVLLQRFVCMCFADLKRYKFLYWFAFPSLSTSRALTVGPAGVRSLADTVGEATAAALLGQWRAQRYEHQGGVAVQRGDDLVHWSHGPEVVAEGRVVLWVCDPGTRAEHPAWPARAVLAVASTWPHVAAVTLVCVRGGSSSASRVLDVALGAGEAVLSAVGHWEKDHKDRSKPQAVQLADQMDPRKVNATAVDLNLKLMKWRVAPALDLAAIRGCKCLLLGAGTLGCHVARALLGWGVRSITFVDNGRVSHSNPVRQSLYEFADCLQGGKPKAEAAAAAVQRIFPECTARGLNLSIPMPGHPISPALMEQTRTTLDTLTAEVEACDVVFLLTDSREARWLGTVLGALKGKTVLNAALGFDSYLVMRHGSRDHVLAPGAERTESLATSAELAVSARTPGAQLGCYFCSDVVAPTDSLRDRTLDQQCTVSRPGISFLASALVVELLVSLLQSPLGHRAAADTAANSGGTDHALGLVPHQLRGFLGNFSTLLVVGHAYDRCTGCSAAVLRGYAADPFGFLVRACADPAFLEDLTGLTAMKAEETDFASHDEDFSME